MGSQNDGELPFTGLGEFTGKLIIAGLALSFGYLFLSTLPRRRREGEST